MLLVSVIPSQPEDLKDCSRLAGIVGVLVLLLFCFVLFFFLEKLRYDHLVSIIKVLVFRNSLILDCAFCDLIKKEIGIFIFFNCDKTYKLDVVREAV